MVVHKFEDFSIQPNSPVMKAIMIELNFAVVVMAVDVCVVAYFIHWQLFFYFFYLFIYFFF